MKTDRTIKALLGTIALFLGMIAFRPYIAAPPVHAQNELFHVYIEPGTHPLRSPDGRAQQYGKVIVDLTTGNVWGFPTLQEAPYPRDPLATKPPLSHPMLLARYAFEDMRK